MDWLPSRIKLSEEYLEEGLCGLLLFLVPSFWLLIELSRLHFGLDSCWGGVLSSDFVCFLVGVDGFSSKIVSSLTFSLMFCLAIGRRFDDLNTGLAGVASSSSIRVGGLEEIGIDSFSAMTGFLNDGHLGGSFRPADGRDSTCSVVLNCDWASFR